MLVQQFLDENEVKYEVIDHPSTYTAQTLAQSVHVTGERVAKTVLLRADDGYALAVVPATHTIDMSSVNTVLGSETVRLAREAECQEVFDDCEVGALPPFGSRYNMRTLVDRTLLESDDIVFEGNTHHEAVRMSVEDFVRLERPIAASFSRHV